MSHVVHTWDWKREGKEPLFVVSDLADAMPR